MPELPEVQTTVDGINKVAKGRTILDVWTDFKSPNKMFNSTVKNPKYFAGFKEKVIGAKIVKSERRAKNILIHLSNKETILVHMKMTGHMMYGTYLYDAKKNSWMPEKGQAALEDPFNRFVHLVFTLDNGKHLVLCDSRKFAKVTIVDNEVKKEIDALGPEPLSDNFTYDVFHTHIQRYPNKFIKTALLDQRLVSGIGNIYSDEILHAAKVLPDRTVSSLSPVDFKNIYKHIKPLLLQGIDFGGDSMSDYRNIYGERGRFQGKHKAYRRTGLGCFNKTCKGVIERSVVNGRSAHFCRNCQK